MELLVETLKKSVKIFSSFSKSTKKGFVAVHKMQHKEIF